MSIVRKFSKWVSIRKARLFYSGVLAFIMLFVSYCLTNLDIALSGEGEIIRNTRAAVDVLIGEKKDYVPDSIVLINVSFDRQLVSYEDAYGIPAGEIDITDRRKLLELLTWLSEEKDYKCILLDVFFNEKYKTNQDSALFETILSLPRLALPNHTDEEIADSRLLPISGVSEYSVNLFHGDLNKVPLADDSANPSLPFLLYKSIGGGNIKMLGPLFFEDGGLIRRCVYPDFTINVINPYDSLGNKTYLNLGADLLENKSILESESIFKDKYVVIGSFEELDMHNTSAGSMSGSLINLNILLSLVHGKQFISFWFALFTFILFWAISYFIITDGLYGHKHRYLALLWAGYSAILIVVCVITYLISSEAYDVFLTASIFSLLHFSLKSFSYLKNKFQHS